MRYSIIIPVYNVASYLNECLNSIYRQYRNDTELVCVDDGSTDDSYSLLTEWKLDYPEMNMVIIQQENRGLAGARNSALRAAHGEYIIMLDSDDVMEEGFLEKLDDYINKYQPDVVAYGVDDWYPERKIDKVVPSEGLSHPEFRYFESGREYLEYLVQLRHRGPTGIFYVFKNGLRANVDPSTGSGVELRTEGDEAMRRVASGDPSIGSGSRRKANGERLMIEKELFFKEGILHEDDLFDSQLIFRAGKMIAVSDLKYQYRRRENSIMTTITDKNGYDRFAIAMELRDFFQRNDYYNTTSKSIIYNIAMNGFLVFVRNGHRRKITLRYWSLVMSTANWKRKVKTIFFFINPSRLEN